MATGQFRSLHFAVRPRVIANYVGQMLLIVAGLTLVPTAVSVVGGTVEVTLRYGIAVALLAGLGYAGARQRLNVRLQQNEALSITALMFVIPPLFFAIPMMGYGLSFLDAVFETVSGVTTTGLSTIPTVEAMPPAFHFGRAWMNWVGGLGVVVLSIAMLMEPGAASRRLGFDSRETDDIVGGTRSHARNIILIYLALTFLGTAAMIAAGANPFPAFVTALSSVSTGGVAMFDDSLAGYDSVWPRAVSLAICFACAISLYMYYRGWYGRWGEMIRDRQTQALFAVTAIVTGVLYVTMRAEGAVAEGTLGEALMQAVSAQTTAGFSTLPVGGLGPASLLVLCVAMFIGGGLGSTAGGIKLFRLLVVVRLMVAMLQRTMTPSHARIRIRLDGKALAPREIEAAVAVIFGAFLVIGASWLVFLIDGHDPILALFEVVSAFANAGLSVGLSAVDLKPVLKLVLIFDMLMGRVETVALIVLLLPATWIGKRRSVK